MQRIYLLCLCAALTGCTAAQRQAKQIHDVSQQAGNELQACGDNITNNQDYDPIRSHLPPPGNHGQPTMEQLADDTRPTKQEAQLLVKYHDDLIPCCQAYLQKIQSVTPTIAQVFTEGWVQGDQITMQLFKRKITWGEAATQKQQVSLNTQKNVMNAAQQVNSALNASHQAELAQRAQLQAQQAQQQAATTNALLQWNAQMQNNRPRMTHTNCSSYYANSIDCQSTSY